MSLLSKPDYLSLPIPKLPPTRFASAGYYTSAYFVIESKIPLPADDGFIYEDVEKFDPENEPDYFLEFGYPEPEPPKKKEDIEQKTIILCHGLATSGLQFVEDAHFFANHGFRVIVPDLRGHGRSIIPKKNLMKKEDFTIKQMANDLIAILDKEQVKQVHWVGHSLGGILALSIMEERKDLIKDLVVFGTSFSFEKLSSLVNLVQVGSKFLSRNNQSQFLAGLLSKKPKTRALAYQMFKEARRDVIFPIARNLSNLDIVDNALSFDSAILMLHGEWDIFTKKAQRITLLEMIGNTKFFYKTIKDAGHLTNLDQPQIVREAILDFVGGGWVFFD